MQSGTGSAEIYRKILDQLSEAFLVVDPSGKILEANAFACSLLGTSSTQLTGNWLKNIIPDSFDSSHSVSFDVSTTSGPQKIDARIIKKFHDDLNLILMKTQSGDSLELKQAVENLQAERILRDQFVSMLTHDLRNPLSAAKITAQLLARQVNNPEKVFSLSGRIITSINRANQMIENLLDANRVKAGMPLYLDMEEISFLPLIEETFQELRSVYGDRFKIENKAGDFKCHGNAEGIRRIIENLCTNAAKYGVEKSEVTVKIDLAHDRIWVSVHNFGNPIPPEEQAQLFDPYRRTSAATAHKSKGWGLGLTLVKGIALAHGGTIEVKSDAESGTSFTVTLLRDARNVSFD